MIEPSISKVRNANPVIEVLDVTRRYGSMTAVSHVSFSVHEGEILGLIGPNGSGKTTLFECLSGMLAVDEGEFLHEGRRLTRTERASALFYLPDGIVPWPAQTLRWSLDFMLGMFRGRLDQREQVVHTLGLEPLLQQPMAALSKGQRKRALLALGLLMPQPLLVADEPFDGLDLRQTREIAAALRSFVRDGRRTMLLSIHQIRDAARVCDRFVLLSGGRVCGQGNLDELSAMAASRGRAVAANDLEEVFLALT